MKKGLLPNGMETFIFSPENKLRIFPPKTFNFKPKDHIKIDEVQQCVLDNLWYQYNHKREERGYFLSILNCLSEYFNHINTFIYTQDKVQMEPHKILYVLYQGKVPGIYLSFEEIIAQKMEEKHQGDTLWMKHTSIDKALASARKLIGFNYYIEPAAKEYMQKYNKTIPDQAPPDTKKAKVKEEPSSSQTTYKQVLEKGIDPLDGEYIDLKIEEKIENIAPKWKKDIKESIVKELKKGIIKETMDIKKEIKEKLKEQVSQITKEIKDNFEKFKEEYDAKFDIPILEEDEPMDTSNHSQNE